MGLRPAFRQMADRLAQSGYAVLVVNQFYRSIKSPFLTTGESFDQPAVRARIMPWTKLLSADRTLRDATALHDVLDKQKEVDTKRGHGDDRLLHGRADGVPHRRPCVAGGCARGRPSTAAAWSATSPTARNKLIPQMKASYLIAIAENDDARAPGDKDVLKAAFAAAKLPAEIEVYAGTMHGWCPPDSRVYNAAQAEKAWAPDARAVPKGALTQRVSIAALIALALLD